MPKNATDKSLTYISENKAIVSVNDEGLISAHSVGNTKITIKAANGITKEITVTVSAAHIAVTSISLSPDESALSMVEGTEHTIQAKVQPENATNKNLTYTSDNEDIVSVDTDGLITAKATGSAKITIKAADGIIKAITVTVTAAPLQVTDIVFNPPLPTEPIELVLGEIYKFDAKVIPEEVTNKKLNFQTSHSSIAWLQGNGNSEVKADGIGEATVTITSDDNPSVKKEVHFKMKQKTLDPSISIQASSILCESRENHDVTFTVKTLDGKLAYTPEIVGDGKKWVSFVSKDTSDSSKDTVHLSVLENKTVWERTAYVKFKGADDKYIKVAGKELEVKLTQNKNENPIVTVKWVYGIGQPTQGEKEAIPVPPNGQAKQFY